MTVIEKFRTAIVYSLSLWHIKEYFTRAEKDEVNRLIESGDLIRTKHLVSLNSKLWKK
jgi:hypothetical protein